MTRSKVPQEDHLRAAGRIVDEVVTTIRNRGYTRQQAMDLAAGELGISPRRVRVLIWQEAGCAVTQDDLQVLTDRYAAHMEAEAVRHLSLADNLRHRAAELRAKGTRNVVAVAKNMPVAHRPPQRRYFGLAAARGACA